MLLVYTHTHSGVCLFFLRQLSTDLVISLSLSLSPRVWYYLFQMRGWMQVVLSLAALCRAVALCLDMLDLLPFEEDAVYPPYHAAADIFYLSVYSLLTLLWGQLCLVAKGHRERILRTIFTVGLGSFYLLFGTTVIAVVSSHHSPKFHTILANMALAELGTANAIVGTLILCFGVRVIIFTQTHGDIALRRPWALSWLVS